MGRRKKENPLDYVTLPNLDINPEIKKGIAILFFLFFGIISFLALFGIAGVFGDKLANILTWLFGWGKWFFPFIIFGFVFLMFFRDKYEIRASNYFGLILLLLSVLSLFMFFVDYDLWNKALKIGQGGGHLGWLLALGVFKLLGFWGGLILIIFLLIISLMLTFNSTLASVLNKGSWPVRFLLHPFAFIFGKIKDNKNEENEEEEEEENEEENNEEEESNEEEENEEEEEENNEEENEGDEEVEPEFSRQDVKGVIVKQTGKVKEKINNPWKTSNIEIDLPFDLLNGKVNKPTSGDIKSHLAVIKKTFEEFNISVEMGEVSIGPTVTQYSLKPADGIKLSKITDLNKNLAMALAADPIRIEAPIPGKSLVGIEVPNKTIATVNLREILESNEFKTRKNNTMISLGKDVAGKVWLADLCKMPHVLVAGQTNSGKSVMLNTLIVSLLYENNPDDLRFIMVDPKRVELNIYNGIPHLLTPVITEVSKTINALKWCLNEMDRRYEMLAKVHKRNIGDYNKTSKDKIPYIVFIIDELADLMMLAGRDIEAGIVRLAQMARAVGIHLVLATQRPSVNVVTGVIKANMPARIAFAVASGIDSRTIIDSLGAEKLLGRGDMLFSDPSMPKPKRIQGAYIDDKEIQRIVNYIKDKADEPQYIEEITERQKVKGVAGVGLDGGSDDDDELVEEAMDIVINAGKASTTFLQRKLGIGYARAAKLVDILEERGIVGPGNGAKGREILISREQYALMESEQVSGVNLHNQEDFVPPENYLETTDDNSNENADLDNNEDDETEESNDEQDEEDNTDEKEDNQENEANKNKKDIYFDKYFSK